MRALLTLLVVFLIASVAFAQANYYSYGWDADPAFRDFMMKYSRELSAMAIAGVIAMVIRFYLTSKKSIFYENPSGINGLTVALFLMFFIFIYTSGADAGAYVGLLIMFAMLAINIKIWQEAKDDNEAFAYIFLSLAAFVKAYFAAQLGQGLITLIMIIIAIMAGIYAFQKSGVGGGGGEKGGKIPRRTTTPSGEIKYYCPNCKTEVSPTDTECPNCGTKFAPEGVSRKELKELEEKIPLDEEGNPKWEEMDIKELFSGKWITPKYAGSLMVFLSKKELKMKKDLRNKLKKIIEYVNGILDLAKKGTLDDNEKQELALLINSDSITWKEIATKFKEYHSRIHSWSKRKCDSKLMNVIMDKMDYYIKRYPGYRNVAANLKGMAAGLKALKKEEHEFYDTLLKGKDKGVITLLNEYNNYSRSATGGAVLEHHGIVPEIHIKNLVHFKGFSIIFQDPRKKWATNEEYSNFLDESKGFSAVNEASFVELLLRALENMIKKEKDFLSDYGELDRIERETESAIEKQEREKEEKEREEIKNQLKEAWSVLNSKVKTELADDKKKELLDAVNAFFKELEKAESINDVENLHTLLCNELIKIEDFAKYLCKYKCEHCKKTFYRPTVTYKCPKYPCPFCGNNVEGEKCSEVKKKR